MKKIITTTLGLLAATSFLCNPVQAAGTAEGIFNVKVELRSSCVTSLSGSNLDFGAYDAFSGPSNTVPAVNIIFKCTQGFGGISLAFNTDPSILASGPIPAPGQPTIGQGVIAGLLYSLFINPISGVTLTPGTPATATLGSGPDFKTFTITGSMPIGQAGLGSSGVTTQPRTLILSF